MLDLRYSLQREPYWPNGKAFLKYDIARSHLQSAALEYIRLKSGMDIVLPLEKLHKQLPICSQKPLDDKLNPFSLYLSETSEQMVEAYYQYIKYMRHELVHFDFVFEANPTLRFHFPVKLPDRFRSSEGTILAYHSDTLLDSPFEEINCWLPLTNCEGNASLLIADFEISKKVLGEFCKEINYDSERYLAGRMDFFNKLNCDKQFQTLVIEACRPLSIDYGNIILFDSRTIHGTAENDTDFTRVSIDFRIIPVDQYEHIKAGYHQAGSSIPCFEGMPIMKGGFYHELTAGEL